jgi:hypothetical protein
MEQPNKKQEPVTLQELLVATLAQIDVLTNLLIEKAVISQGEYMEKLSAERAVYQKLLNPTVQ